MGLLDTSMSDDATYFIDTDEFAEAVTYTPLGGTAKSINAIVVRDEPAQLGETAARSLAADLTIAIRNDATAGVTSVNTGGDRVTVARRYGETAKSLQVYEVISSDAAIWRLRLR